LFTNKTPWECCTDCQVHSHLLHCIAFHGDMSCLTMTRWVQRLSQPDTASWIINSVSSWLVQKVVQPALLAGSPCWLNIPLLRRLSPCRASHKSPVKRAVGAQLPLKMTFWSIALYLI
jgi:hypothetical protein